MCLGSLQHYAVLIGASGPNVAGAGQPSRKGRPVVESKRAVLTAVATFAAVAVGAVSIYAGEQVLSAQLDAQMVPVAQTLLPEGSLDVVQVTDDPAMLALLSPRRQQTVAEGVDSLGGRVYLIIREFDTDTSTAVSASWLLLDREFANGLLQSTALNAPYAEGVIDGRHLEVQIAARVEGDVVVIEVYDVSIDGQRVEFDDLSEEIRTVLAPVRIPVPFPQSAAVVSGVSFMESEVTVELNARDLHIEGSR